jgi:peptidoglycan/LPS O-acetylase OafA/YrhL
MTARAEAFARVPGIDVLRGLAIVLVLLHHTGIRIPLADNPIAGWLPETVVDTLMARGFEAVYVFFAISGFLITGHALARRGELGRLDVRAFYARRAARILPCLVILVGVLTVLAVAKVPHYEIDRPDQSIAGAVAAALGCRINWYESTTGYLPASWDVLWSLSVEEAFYLGFPLLCLTLGRSRALVPVLIAFALSLAWWRHGRHGLWLEKADAPGMCAIACGMLGALALHRWPRAPRSTARWLTAFGVLALVAAGPFELPLWRSVHDGFLLVVAAASAALCVACAWRANRRLARPATSRFAAALELAGAPLRAFGRLSYEIYLTHIFVMWLVVDAFGALGSPAWAALPAHLLVLALAWALGWTTARALSEPARRRLMARRRAVACLQGNPS